MPNYSLGIDIGGTFTDIVVHDHDAGRQWTRNGRSVDNRRQHLIGCGDRILVRTPGGGGYGPAAERDPALTARDRTLGYTSRSGTKKT